MVFDRLKAAFTGAPAGPNKSLTEALKPLRAVSDQLFERAVAFVHTGAGPDVLLDLDATHNPDATVALGEPNQVTSWRPWYRDPLGEKLKKLGIGGDLREAIPALRNQFYRNNAISQPEFLRFGYLLAALGTGPNRKVDGVPAWLTALTNDIAGSLQRGGLKYLPWVPERFADLLRHDGHPEADIPTTVVLALSQRENVWGSRIVQPHELPGIDNYLLGFAHLIPPAAVTRLNADGRAGIAERATANPQVAPVLAPVLAHLAADKAKGPRTKAIEALPLLPWEHQVAVLRPVLASVPASQASELIGYLSRTAEGGALLDEAVAAGAKIGTAVAKANARRQVVHEAAAADQPVLVIPDFTPFPNEIDEARVVTELRRVIDGLIARQQNSTYRGAAETRKRLQVITDRDLQQVAEAAAGRLARPKVLDSVNTYQVSGQLGLFNPVHLLRLNPEQRRSRLDWALYGSLDQITDLRQVEDAIRRTWNSADALAAVPDLARQSQWGETVEAEAAWPWFAERLDVLQNWLTSSAQNATDALYVLDAFPALPPALLPSIAALATGESRRNRPAAQALLAKHNLASGLAGQGLTDGKAEIRAASAAWLGRVGEPDAVPGLRAALAKEKREVPRAAMLTALRELGDDIDADLAPDVLLAEATKGLKAKVPPALSDWFGFDQLPALTWADGTAVDPSIPTWWVVLANKVKDPDGSGMFDLYLSRLSPDSAEALGRFLLASWIAQDTRNPSEEECRAHAEIEGPKQLKWAQDNLARLVSQQAGNPNNAGYVDWYRQRAAIPVEQYIREAYAAHQGIYLGSAAAHRGLLALTTRMPGIELANAVQSYIRNHGGRRAQVDALMYPLYANGQPAAVQLLLSISRRFKQASVQATATTLVEKLADKRGWTADELADRTIPTAGFDADALLRLDFGSREFIGRATPSGTIELTNPDGKAIKSLPAARAGDDDELVKEAKKQLTTSRKELKAVLTQQTARLYEAMCAGRAWAASDWREFLLEHPLVGQLVSRLVWLENPGPQQRAFRPTEDGSLIDADDDTLELAEDATVGLAHVMTIGDQAAAQWRQHLTDYEVTPLFDQFTATLPAIDRTGTEVSDLQGHLTDTFSIRGVATKRGYQRGAAEDGAYFDEYSKKFTGAGLTAVLTFTGSYLPEENFGAAVTTLSFRGVRHKTVTLADVPDILLAECYADYAALAALGPFDPDWEKKTGV